MIHVTQREAQALAVIASRLDRKHIFRKITADDVLDTLLHLGMIQLDTISVVSRSHETVLWSRLGRYDPALITELFTVRKALTEYVTHAAAITPTTYLPLLREMMQRHQTEDDWWIHQPDVAPIAKSVLQRVRKEGALSSRHFEAPPETERTGQWESWYGNKPERRVLANLWFSGDLLISLRDRSFTRWFDLPERVAPDHWHAESPAPEELPAIFLGHAMRSLGIATVPWLSDYWRTGGRAYVSGAEVRSVMPELVENGDVIPASIPGISEDAWLDASLTPALEELRSGRGWPTKTTFLSPFDNLIWNRARMEQLWGMHYRIEIYTPAAKRVYGYYNMPILHRGRLVGRIDPSMNRREGVLTIRSVHLEAGVKVTPALVNAVARTLDDFVHFLGGTVWRLEQSNPPEFAIAIQQDRG